MFCGYDMQLLTIVPFDLDALLKLKDNPIIFLPITNPIFVSFSIQINYMFWAEHKMSALYIPVDICLDEIDLSDLFNDMKIKEIITVENEYVLRTTIFRTFRGIIKEIC